MEGGKEEFIQRCKMVFDALDEVEDDRIPSTSLGRFIRAIGLNPSDDEIADMIIDMEEDGWIDFHCAVYAAYRHARSYKPEEELKAAFRAFCKDGSGMLPVETVSSILKSIRKPMSDRQIKDVIAAAKPRQGKVDYSVIAHLLFA